MNEEIENLKTMKQQNQELENQVKELTDEKEKINDELILLMKDSKPDKLKEEIKQNRETIKKL